MDILPNPKKLNKYLYITKTPTWRVRLLFGFAILALSIVVLEFSFAIIGDMLYRWLITPLIFVVALYHYWNFFVAFLFYKQFDLKKHRALLKSYWGTGNEPSVDVFLPICGENIQVLANTWKHVAELNYTNKQVYVLDDSKSNNAKHEALAKQYGFHYLSRTNKGEMKKAGNLKFGFFQTKGEFIAIFDADFAPHPDFLRELVPHMSEQNTGIVQSPQYFELNNKVHKNSPIAYGAGYVQQDFYRITQVARDRIGGALCCGTNALYRRAALDSIGGPLQVPYSEDSRTGFALETNGWRVRYVPIILASGICPDNTYAYFHQQHRWCSGSTELMTSKTFWTAPVKWRTKLCYLEGFFYYFHHPFSLLMSFHLFIGLFFYNNYINFWNSIPFLPFLVWLFIISPLYHLAWLRRGVFMATMVQLYAYVHAITTVIMGKSVGWIATNAKHTDVSPAFRQVLTIVYLYIFAYIALIGLAARKGVLHLAILNYYSVQFWLFYNLLLSGMVLASMYRFMMQSYRQRNENGALSSARMTVWHLKTAGPASLLLIFTFCSILWLT